MKVFSTTTCPVCKQLLEKLKNKKVEYVVVYLDKDKEELDNYIRLGYTHVPMVEHEGKYYNYKQAVATFML